MCNDPSPKPSLKAVLNNWRENEAPFYRKLGMAIKNNWRKIKTGKSCCGNHGEVGC